MGEVCVWGGGGGVVGLWLSCLWKGFLYVAPNDGSESLLMKSIVKKKKKKKKKKNFFVVTSVVTL